MTNMKKRIATTLTVAILTTVLTVPAMATETPDKSVRVSSYKGSTLEAGERSGLIIGPRCDCIGVGVTQYDGITYCYMFVGIPNSVNFYA